MTRLTVPTRALPLPPREPAVTGSPPGFSAYLVLAVALAPVCVPAGPGNIAILDFLNLIVLAVFGLMVLFPGRRLHAPLLVPVAIIAAGSLLATVGAPSGKQAAIAMAQDVYLFFWFLALVNLIRGERDLRLARVAWMWTAVAISLIALGQLFLAYGSLSTLLGSRGLRPAATLYNPNMTADYLVISVFVAASLAGQVRNLVLLPSLGVILVGILATKSNGGMLSLAAGAAVWGTVRLATSRVRPHLVATGLLIVVGLGAFGLWLNREWRVGDSTLAVLFQSTFAGRMEKSQASRERIWDSLERAYQRSPLGIGPGNSNMLTLSITERERPDSYQSKEAHSDYLAYAVERGPLGLVGLLVLTGVLFAQVAATWRDRVHRGERRRRMARWVAAAAAALTASAAHSAVIEKLHFRHFWLLLALVSAAALTARRHAERRRSRGVVPAEPEPVRATLPPPRPTRPRWRPAGYLKRVWA